MSACRDAAAARHAKTLHNLHTAFIKAKEDRDRLQMLPVTRDRRERLAQLDKTLAKLAGLIQEAAAPD